MPREQKPNVIFVFGDQWRQQATGYSGNPDVHTPHIDAFAREGINFTHAVSGASVCCPYRASLLTGQRALTHGVFVNDVYLQPNGASIAETFSSDGYDTAYIGKWHVDGHGRSNYIPQERRLGFDYWKVLECTHDYNESSYYAHDSEEKLQWEGYDAIAQTEDAVDYIRSHGSERPFLLMLSWGPPHAPYGTAPDAYKKLYNEEGLALRPNVPNSSADEARESLAGYYAHCTALDDCFGRLLREIGTSGQEENTIVVFTSDHGDMLGSHGSAKKQQPWDESIRVPFLVRYPRMLGRTPRRTDALIDSADIMPTLLGLCNITTPDTVEGLDFSGHITGGEDPTDGSVLITCPHPFGQWDAKSHGGREYRGLRTKRYTYVRDLKGPWLLYDNEQDPYQLTNLIADENSSQIRERLDEELQRKLDSYGDEFLPGSEYLREWGYEVDETGTVPYTW